MRNTTNIWMSKALWFIKLGIVGFVMIAAISLALMISEADAQNHYSHMGWHNGIAYLAEKEIREAEIRKAEKKANVINAKSETQVVAPADAATGDNEEEHSSNCRLTMVKEDTKC
jgi:hypothetical protein